MDTLIPVTLCPVTQKPLPSTLAGYQAVENGKILEGDLLRDKEAQECCICLEWAKGVLGSDVQAWNHRYTVYRKLPVAVHLDNPVASQGSPSKALTYDDGKPSLASIPPEGIRAVARVQGYGKKKYGNDENYRLGMEAKRQMSCVLRHVFAYLDGEDNDKESGESHLAHAATRLMFALQNIKDGTMIDDRFKRAS